MLMYGLNIQILYNVRAPTRPSLGAHFNAFRPPRAPQEHIAIAIATEYAASAPLDIPAQAPTQAFICHLNALLENTAIQRDFQLIREIVGGDLILLAGQQLYRVRPAPLDFTAPTLAHCRPCRVPLENIAVQRDFQLIVNI